MKTDPRYWDCECEENFIHDNRVGTFCPRCRTRAQDQPDSRPEEVRAGYNRKSDDAVGERNSHKKAHGRIHRAGVRQENDGNMATTVLQALGF
jgi:hypothetical protein